MIRENNPLRNWLVFSRSEKRGIAFLLILIVILLAVRFLQKNNIGNKAIEVENQSEINVKSKFTYQNKLGDTSSKSLLISSTPSIAPGEIFDPNEADMEELIDQGIPENIAGRIINYRLKGGVFYEPADLYKIYGIDSLLVTELLPWVIIKVTRPVNLTCTSSYELYLINSDIKVEINSADSSIFCKLGGIGPVLSRRIIKYREILGGYYSIEQLSEVYGISDSLLSTFAHNLSIDTSMIEKMDINSATYYELRKHPYLNNYEAKSILSYRRIIGPFTTYEELVENYILSENTYRKVRSYLSLN